ncbi:MAG: hypothetical protein QM759_10610 [Terricaulis sp.]
MKTALAAALLFTAASAASFALAQESVAPPMEQANPNASATPAPETNEAPDARQVATDADVGAARRYYRAQCNKHESAAFCECVTAGVAQALTPQEVRIAARGIGERINAQGDGAQGGNTDQAGVGANSMSRIEQVEGHYADACQQFRG